jgi:hypothetical protein
LEREDGVVWTGVVWLRGGTGASYCECGNVPLGFMKCWEPIKWLHNLSPLE